ncbi:MAG: RsmB/NOP family class I SAM-dependent RNA methyltransferase [Calditrichaeota bacterium]|nr:MAG: RsmB/NOP family class I SAM-dependent RNA methyltransferase [Calditrichota bacterium]MBL1205976.1 RsmB/NOP family class I SAM-dependent RNA methyltransferase [Calditrichota bacterium]NOG45804.1 RsmB/NOP family class I SAM-dependent RNA methyltransferase [Calditrichota bacterium]
MENERLIKNEELSEYLKNLLGADENNFLNAQAEQKSIRINNLKENYPAIIDKLQNNGFKLKELPFTKIGYFLEEAPFSLSHSLGFFKGNFAFQGASSQIPPIVLDPKPGENVLDMAAAPGSKSTQLGVLMNNSGHLVINDSNIKRMQALNANLQKTGLINHCVYYSAGERLGRLFPQYFDKVLLDTPCTGLGTLATHKEIKAWWSYEKLAKINGIQHQLFVSAIKATKVGGEIVYSTCSIAPEENELIVERMINKYPLEVLPIENEGLQQFDDGWTKYKDVQLSPSLKHTKRIWSHKHGMEGFYIARLRKTEEFYNKKYPVKVGFLNTLAFDDENVSEILTDISESWGIDNSVWPNYRFHKTKERIYLFSKDVKKIVIEGFTNGGLFLAEKRLHIWKLTHPSIQHFEDKISKRRLALDGESLTLLFETGKCPAPQGFDGYYALEIDGKPGAIVFIQNAEVRIKLSHAFLISDNQL